MNFDDDLATRLIGLDDCQLSTVATFATECSRPFVDRIANEVTRFFCTDVLYRSWISVKTGVRSSDYEACINKLQLLPEANIDDSNTPSFKVTIALGGYYYLLKCWHGNECQNSALNSCRATLSLMQGLDFVLFTDMKPVITDESDSDDFGPNEHLIAAALRRAIDHVRDIKKTKDKRIMDRLKVDASDASEEIASQMESYINRAYGKVIKL
jgi:hypothetical protein